MERISFIRSLDRSNDDAIDSFASLDAIDHDLTNNIVPKDNINEPKSDQDDSFDLLDNIFSKDSKKK